MNTTLKAQHLKERYLKARHLKARHLKAKGAPRMTHQLRAVSSQARVSSRSVRLLEAP